MGSCRFVSLSFLLVQMLLVIASLVSLGLGQAPTMVPCTPTDITGLANLNVTIDGLISVFLDPTTQAPFFAKLHSTVSANCTNCMVSVLQQLETFPSECKTVCGTDDASSCDECRGLIDGALDSACTDDTAEEEA